MVKLDTQWLRERREQEAALGFRGYGKKKLADAIAEIEEALDGVGGPDVHGGDPEDPSLLRMLGWVADPDQYDSEIPRDSDAMNALENLAFAIGIAFDLGRYAPPRDPKAATAHKEHLRLTESRREGGRDSGGKLKDAADDRWRAEAKKKWHEARGSFAEEDPRCLSQSKVADIVELEVLRDKVKNPPDRDTVIKEIRKWDRALRAAGFWSPAWRPKKKALPAAGL